MPNGLRALLVRLHRWVGLVIALFLVLTGLTGSVLAFREPLDRWLNPDLLVVQIRAGSRPLPAALMIRKVQRALPEAEPRYWPMYVPAGESLKLRMAARAEARSPLSYDEAFFDPYAGRLLGVRLSEANLFNRRSTIGFLYRLHRELALPANWGSLTLGIIALLWTIDSMVGFALTLPTAVRRPTRKSFWNRWRLAWSIKRRASPSRRLLDLHRAGGLWLWGALLLFGWSSVMLTLNPVYRAVMEQFVRFDDPRALIAAKQFDAKPLRLGWADAIAIGRASMPDLGRRHGFTIEREGDLARDKSRNLYIYYVRSSLDIRDDGASTGVLIDAFGGKIIGLALPTHPNARGNAINQWLYGLHMADIFGLPYRLLIAIFGMAVATLSITGIAVWWVKWRARAHHLRRARQGRPHHARARSS